MIILIPLPLFFASTVYSKGGLTVWVIVGIAWTFCSAIAVVLYPLWESRAALTQIVRGIVKVSALLAVTLERCQVISYLCFIGYIYDGRWKIRGTHHNGCSVIWLCTGTCNVGICRTIWIYE